MGLTSLQVCMDSSDWFQGAMHEGESGMDSSSPSGGGGGVDMDMLTCARPNMIERRLRPPHDQALKCPRCDSTHTKFCYYNNYSLSQPRYFCKTCRRYWTKGGTLRNIPVGGGCRKNKKVSKKPSSSSSSADHSPIGTPINPTDLHLSFPADVQYLLGTHHHSSFIEAKYNAMLNENNGNNHNNNNNHPVNVTSARPIDFMMESKLEAMHSSSRNNNYDFMAGGDHMGNFNPLCSPFGMGFDHHLNNNSNNNNSNINIGGSSSGFMDSCGQRLMLPYEDHQNIAMDVKPKLLSLEWQDQQQRQQQQIGCTDTGKDSFGYLGSWSGMINGYGSSATNPLV